MGENNKKLKNHPLKSNHFSDNYIDKRK